MSEPNQDHIIHVANLIAAKREEIAVWENVIRMLREEPDENTEARVETRQRHIAPLQDELRGMCLDMRAVCHGSAPSLVTLPEAPLTAREAALIPPSGKEV